MVPQFSQKEELAYRHNTERWLKFGVKAQTLHFKAQQTYTSTSFAFAGKQSLVTTLLWHKN